MLPLFHLWIFNIFISIWFDCLADLKESDAKRKWISAFLIRARTAALASTATTNTCVNVSPVSAASTVTWPSPRGYFTLIIAGIIHAGHR